MACASGLARTARLNLFLRLGNNMCRADAHWAIASMRECSRFERISAKKYLRQDISDEQLATISICIKKQSTPYSFCSLLLYCDERAAREWVNSAAPFKAAANIVRSNLVVCERRHYAHNLCPIELDFTASIGERIVVLLASSVEHVKIDELRIDERRKVAL